MVADFRFDEAFVSLVKVWRLTVNDLTRLRLLFFNRETRRSSEGGAGMFGRLAPCAEGCHRQTPDS